MQIQWFIGFPSPFFSKKNGRLTNWPIGLYLDDRYGGYGRIEVYTSGIDQKLGRESDAYFKTQKKCASNI